MPAPAQDSENSAPVARHRRGGFVLKQRCRIDKKSDTPTVAVRVSLAVMTQAS